MAAELLDIYASRAAHPGYPFSPPDDMYRQFEADFEFEETPDQAKAIEDVLVDMQQPKPMDRLVCGDVGYGKTEVALRAAFKALGLGVVDEEQRFGVKHKEQLKKLRKLVDVLTLTATPIPRTLHMAMMGVRDLSIIGTPPVDRRAIRTFVSKFDGATIKEAI